MDDRQGQQPSQGRPSFKVVPEPEQGLAPKPETSAGPEVQSKNEVSGARIQSEPETSPEVKVSDEPVELEPEPKAGAAPEVVSQIKPKLKPEVEPEIKPETGIREKKQPEKKDIFASIKKASDKPTISLSNTDSEQPSQQPTAPIKKKPVLLFIILVLLLLGAAVLGFLFLRGKKKEQEVVTLTYWGLWEPEPAVQGVIAEYEKENPNIKVQYLEQDKEDYRLRLQSAFDRGEGPDIFRFHQTWIPMMKKELVPVPQTVANSLGLDSDYFPIIKESLNQGGQYYGVPLMVDALALYYNKDILAAANKSPPRTWWGLENLAKELTVRPDEKITVAGAALGTTNNVDHWSDIIGLMIYQNGGNPGEVNSLIEDVLNYYLRFKNVDYVWDETLPNSTLAFANGKLAFYFAPSWRVFNLLDTNPNLNFGITAVPQLPKLENVDWQAAERGEGELTKVGWASFWAEGVWSGSKKQTEAWNFLNFLGSKESLQKLYTAQSQIRLFGEIYPRTDLASSLDPEPMIKPFIDQAKIAKSWYLSSSTHGVGINDRMIKYYNDAINSLDQGSQADDVLETLSSGIDQVLNQYGLSSSP